MAVHNNIHILQLYGTFEAFELLSHLADRGGTIDSHSLLQGRFPITDI